MPLPLIAGAVGSMVARRVGTGILGRVAGRVVRGGRAVGRAAVGAAGIARAVPGIRGVGRRRRIPSLSASEMGKLIFMSQVLGKRSPAMTMIVMKALGGRL